MTTTATRLATGSGAGALRRRLGPLAWCALECLAERADSQDDPAVVHASVRAVAADLGVAKNTAHRAITALVDAGLVSPEQDRAGDGRFRAGRYVLHLGDLADLADLVTRQAPKPARRRPVAATGHTQLSLLGPV